MNPVRPRRLRALWIAAELLVAVGAIAWWWSARDDGASRLEPVAPRTTAERNVAALPIAPAGERTPVEVAAVPQPVATPPSVVASASPLLEPDRVVVVSGVVVGAADGAPIEGAELSVGGDIWGGARGDGDTDEQGRYEVRLEGGVPARVRIRAAAEGFALAEVLLAVDPDATELRADFRLRKGFEVAVEVVRAVDGAPIPFASVALGHEAWTRNDASHEGETDESGRWIEGEIGDLPRHDLAVVVEAEGFAPRRFGPLALPDDGDRLELRCELSPPRSLSGIVVSSGGGPVAGARVEISSLHRDFEHGGDEAECDEVGRFTLDAGGVPEVLATLIVSADGFQAMRLDRPWAHDGGVVTIVLPAPFAAWKGRVVDRVTGRGVLEGHLMASPLGVPERGVSFVEGIALDDEGRFEVPLASLPFGDAIDLWVHASGYASRTFVLPLLHDGAASLPAVIELERVVILRGRILDVASGQPIGRQRPSVTVVLDRAVPSEGSFPGDDVASRNDDTTAEHDGSFVLELPLSAARAAGRCSIVVEHDRRRHALGRLDLRPYLDRAAPGTPVEITLDLPIDASPRRLGDGK